MCKKVAPGIYPVAERKKERQTVPTSRDAAKLVHDEHEKAWKNGKHQNQWLVTLTTYAFLKIGDLPVYKIEGPAISGGSDPDLAFRAGDGEAGTATHRHGSRLGLC